MSRFPGYDDTLHQKVSAWFLGPRAENFGYLQSVLQTVLNAQGKARNEYYPGDPSFITPGMQDSTPFKGQIDKLNRGVSELAENLSKHHVPFWNPRYNGHMTNDTTLPGIAGYLTAMLFNPNNVAAEASPLTTWLEKRVGEDLCKMVRYNVDNPEKPRAWGHITCDGSVANLESIWAARNLKFYPLSLVLAMKEGNPLDFIANSFKVSTCKGEAKYLRDFSTWELLNITPEEVLDIPDRLYSQYNISPAFLQDALNPYLIQSIAKDATIFEETFGRAYINQIAYITSATKHYSWPKGAAVTGIGSENLINITVDHGARMDLDDLRRNLDDCLNANPPRAVYAVVAIIGSTEHGACDPLEKIVEMREEYRKKGLSFVLHADGAWGTYFASTLEEDGGRGDEDVPFVPSIALKPETQASLRNLRHCDSITVDPHKSGYIQYPAGGLLYRDGRMRYLVTWTSPVVNRVGEESIGVYGIEGSKPGAAPVATWLSHEVIGLNPEGYGALLGEAVFGCAMMYAYLVTMSNVDTDFIVTPLNLLPAEIKGKGVESQKDFIREHILRVPNEVLVKDEKAMALITEMGSDLSINAFAVNFKVDDKANKDVICANDLNRRIFERLSLVSPDNTPKGIPLFLTSTQFPQKSYGECLRTYKLRLELNPDGPEDLYSLINVVMSPFPTEYTFTAKVIEEFQKVIQEEVKTSQDWNTISPDYHGFVMQGTDKLYLVHLPMFNMANHRYQLIITGDLPAEAMATYVNERKKDPSQLYTLGNVNKEVLETLLTEGSFRVHVDKGMPPNSSPILPDVLLSNVRVIVNRKLDSSYLSTTYPKSTMPFFLYGTGDQLHIDHALLASPSIQLNSDQVKLTTPLGEALKDAPYVVAHFKNTPEKAMQPFPNNETIRLNEKFFFKPGAKSSVSITKDLEGKEEIGEGELTLGNIAFYDNNDINMFPAASKPTASAPKAPMDAGPAKSRDWMDLIDSMAETIRSA